VIAHQISPGTIFFCGAGGATSGILQVSGNRVVRALNHDPTAIETHWTNHPAVEHICEGVESSDGVIDLS